MTRSTFASILRGGALVTSAALLFTIGCAAQQKPTTIQGVASMTSMDDIMRLQAHKIGVFLGKASETNFKPAEYGDISRAATYLIAIGKRLSTHFSKRPKFGDGFKMFADALSRDAAKLKAASDAKNGAEVSASLKSIKATCGGCHAKYQKKH